MAKNEKDKIASEASSGEMIEIVGVSFREAGKICSFVVENENFGNNEKELIASAAYLKSIIK